MAKAGRRSQGRKAGQGARTTIEIRGARVHNLRDVSLEIPRDKLVVVTGLSGSGKSSLAFDTLYAEGQRRYMESLSTFAKRFIAQVAKPEVDFVFGLSPVISIEQKTGGRNPRSTVGTMTDVSGYLNLLFATIGQPHCPRCRAPVPALTKTQVLEALQSLPAGALVELRAPVFPVYGEDLDFLFAELRKKGYRKLLVDGRLLDTSEEADLDESAVREMDVVVDRLVVGKDNERQLLTAIQNALLVGDQLLSIHVVRGANKAQAQRFYQAFGCPQHHLVAADLTPDYFMFNDPASACRACMGLGTYKRVHLDLLVPDKSRSIRDGCFVREAFCYRPDNWNGRILYSLSRHLGFDLDTPFGELPPGVVEVLLHGTHGKKFPLLRPPDAREFDDRYLNKPWGFDGIARRIERTYKRYRQEQVAHSGMEAWLEKVMVEHGCPACAGSRLKDTRLLVTVHGKDIREVGEIHFSDLSGFLKGIDLSHKKGAAARQVVKEISGRLGLLVGIGLNYLNFNRRSSTLSGGEAQRIRLSTQIGSGLMGMLYVLDEPSIGLHPKDNEKMIATLRRLRDLGNTVIVVEHDEETIRAADHVIEMGPGPGVHGGTVVVQGTVKDVLACRSSPTGQYLSGRKAIPVPAGRRAGNGQALVIRGARENNLKGIDVRLPLGTFTCITGASGSGKSTLVNEILFKKLHNVLVDSRILSGDHEALEGVEQISKVVNIDQSALGRNSRSNPATYLGFYDDIRTLFAETPLARERGYTAGRFSFNVKTGRCPECAGEGTIHTQLYFMPDVEALCESCKGARYNPETLEVTYKGKTIADVLNTSIEEGVAFFADLPAIARKVGVLDELGLGYLTLGQSATTLSGGEAQRVKLAAELSRLRRGGQHVLYILDEPTTGLHLADVNRLLECLHRLVDAGHTVLVIEHHLDVIKTADWVIDLGPEGGHHGGEVVAEGTPEQVARCKRSHTGRYLREQLRARAA